MEKNVTYQLSLLEINRKSILELIEQYSLEQLNTTPPPFSNNLIWNFGHTIVTQQRLQYGLSGLRTPIDNDIIQKYGKGSRPESSVSRDEYAYLKEKCLEMPKQLKKDLEDGLFQEYKHYTTSRGFELKSIEDAITFNNIHEALHYGTMMAIRKFL